MMIGGGNYGTAGQHHSGCSFLKFIGIFMTMLIISLPVAFADELQLTYDANGNLLSGDGYNRTYNSLNQLVEIRNSTGSLLEEFVYHPVEERILVKKVYNSSGSIKERIIYVDDNFVRVVNSSGSFDFTYVMHEGQKVAEELNGVKKFTITDHLGSTGAITDSVGTVVEQTTYSPYGEIISGGSSRFDYEGKEFDSVVGDYDFHFRKFLGNPPIFTQPDTLIQNVYDPQSLNRYMFERGNPYGNVDEDGHIVSNIPLLGVIPAILTKIEFNIKYYLLKKETNDPELISEIEKYRESMNKATNKDIVGCIYGADCPYGFDPVKSIGLDKIVGRSPQPYNYEEYYNAISNKVNSINHIKEGRNAYFDKEGHFHQSTGGYERNPVDVKAGIDASKTSYNPKTGREIVHKE